MIVYDGFYFASAPGTGEEWFVQAAQLAGMGPAFLNRVWDGFDEKRNGCLRVSLVRHPWDWLKWYWLEGQKINNPYLREFQPLTINQRDNTPCMFTQFIANYLNNAPGAISRLVLSYGADTYIRIEDCPAAFLEFARSLGVNYALMRNRFYYTDASIIGEGKHFVNVQSLSVLQAEREIVHAFDYF